MPSLRSYFEKYLKIPDEYWEVFSSQLVRHEYPAKTTILKVGQVEKYISFIEKGSVRFYIPKEENELTFAFIFENDLMCAYDSFLTQSPCQYCTETITPTILWSFSYDFLQKLYNEVPSTNIIGRIASEEIYLKKAKRELALLNESPEERYLKLFSEHPILLQQIPLKYIASYIGVTPQALSRIRRRIIS